LKIYFSPDRQADERFGYLAGMKRLVIWIGLLLLSYACNAQLRPFRFAFLSDTHIGSPDGKAEEDLRRSIADINQMNDIAFVVITGDITELGTNEELLQAKQLFDQLHVPYHIIPGNHDAGWSESGGDAFQRTFGDDKFGFVYDGILFLGCASGPYLRMSDGHVPRSAINWLDRQLAPLDKEQPVIFLNHYPIDNSLDNWYEITDRLHRYNTWAILCGHGHTNRAMNFEDIPAVMGRSNLRAKAPVGGYNLVDVRPDSLVFSERRPGVETLAPWTRIAIETRHFKEDKKFARPSFAINQEYPAVREVWTLSSKANIISTPAVEGERVVVGNQDGTMICVSRRNGKELWNYQARGAIFSSPAIAGGRVVFGSADGMIHCLSLSNGKPVWSLKRSAAVLGCPLVSGDTVYIGGSDHSFIALELQTGNILWSFTGLEGPVVSTPVIYEEKIIFGAWDRNLYAVDKRSGQFIWKWNNGSPIRNYSPAACMPVVHDGVIYIVAPDRYISAIDARDGHTLWRNNDATVRESIGISADGLYIYAKTMQDTIVAYRSSRDKQSVTWKLNCGFGYEHVPSMLIEREGKVFFGTRNGVVYAIDPHQPKLLWAHKIDNSMVNTVRATDNHHLVVSTMDGKLTLLEFD
jgi:outer membrane protein assembly factor BamB